MSPTRADTVAQPLAAIDAKSMIVKRFFDILIAGALLILCLPLLALTAIAVYLALGRPLFFRQERAGRRMLPFQISKFRTMTDERDDTGTLLPDHLRQSPTTLFLRRIRVDELPQLLAVLRGDMSIVGPRPLPCNAVRDFGELGQARCTVRPGMTGWAQVNGNTLLTARQKIALDIWYIDHRDLKMDIRILLMTLRTVAIGEKVDAENLRKAQMHLWRRGALNASFHT
ncbi:MAG: undecaprenyl-phosphate galactose phosphotransferase [Rhizobium sp.]|nr:undecaprenyl-phosphate galactose phosphotransferase [Rhizobium sp.]